jgi:Bacteriophage lambda ea8.5-related domain
VGRAKDQWIHEQDLYQAALGVLVEAGTLQECEYHEGIFFQGSGDLTAAYKLANYQISKEGGAEPGERRDLTDAIKKAYGENSFSDRCERCHDPKR